MTTTPFPSWEAKHRDASNIVQEAYGWASNIDQSDDEQVLMWARNYLPRVIEHGEREVLGYDDSADALFVDASRAALGKGCDE